MNYKEKEIFISPLNLQKVEFEDFNNLFVHSEHNNETGTHKDRKAEEFRKRFEPIQYNLKDWIFSIISSGSMAHAMQNMLRKNGGNNLRVLLDRNTDESVIKKLLKINCELYVDDLSRKDFSPKCILEATENISERGKDLTSMYEGQFSGSYLDLATDIFKENPDHIITPFGTGEFFSAINIIGFSDLESKSIKMYFNAIGRESLNIKLNTSLWAAHTKNPNTKMNKLYAPKLPFISDIFKSRHYGEPNMYSVENMIDFSNNVKDSQILEVSENNLAKAKEIYDGMNIPAEPSALSSMALFLENKNLFKKDEKIIIFSTGKLK